MAYEEALVSITLEADATLAVATGVPGQPGAADPNGGHQYKFVQITGVKTVGLADATVTDSVIGVLQNKPQATGAAATVAISGVSKVEAGATITAGNPIAVKADGTAEVGLTGEPIVGFALTSGADGEIISVLLAGPGANPILS